jgi:NitT/TauT family transport system substrate-binding protein
MTDSIRIMVYRHSAFYSPLIGAIAGGFLKQQGLEVTYFTKPKERSLYEMFRSGDVDVMQAAVSTSWDPLSKGITGIPKHFAQINQRDGFFIAARSADRFEWRDLEGASLVADHAQQPFVMLKHAGRMAGLDWSRVRLIDAGPPGEMDAAFRSGVGEFIHLQGPGPQQLEADRVARVVACVGETLPPVAFSSLMALPSFLESAVARAFMKAYRRALEWTNNAPPDEIAAAEAPYFPNVSRAALSAAIGQYQQLGTWRLDPAIPRDQYETAMDIFLAGGVFSRRFPYEDVVTPPPDPA